MVAPTAPSANDEARAQPSEVHGAPTALGTAVRVLSHLVIWTAVLVPVLVRMARGWRAVWDDAYLSLHALQVFSLNSPLVGVWTSSSEGAAHSFHDLGPLPFWLLAVPVRIDPAQGALWGAALWCAVILSVSAEAAWSVKGWPACSAVAGSVAIILWVDPSVFARTVWNPNMGFVFLMASLVLAWCVASGAVGWWPVLVFTGSVAAQSHLIFAANALGLIIIPPIVGMLNGGSRSRRRWMVVGLITGLACWIAPLIQQLTGNPGNLWLLVHSNHHRPVLGTGFGFQVLGDAGSVPPIWLSHFPVPVDLAALEEFHAFAYAHSALYGALVLVGAVGVTAWAWRSDRRALASLGIVACVSSISVVVSFAAVPTATFLVLGYLLVYIWIVGIALWCLLLWAAYEGCRYWIRRLAPGHGVRRFGAIGSYGPVLGALALLTIAAIAAGATLRTSPALDVASTSYQQVQRLTAAVEHDVPRGPVRFELLPRTLSMNTYGSDETGMDWQLTVDGWQTGLPTALHQDDGYTPPEVTWPTVVVTLHGDGRVTAVRIR